MTLFDIRVTTTVNRRVVGSSPTWGAIFEKKVRIFGLFSFIRRNLQQRFSCNLLDKFLLFRYNRDNQFRKNGGDPMNNAWMQTTYTVA